MSREPSFQSCYLHEDAGQPNLFTLYERWREPSVEAFLQNQDKPYRREYDSKLPQWLESPRQAQVLKDLGQWIR
ncbi:hypothetical protein J0A66_08135 [Bowmanella dokdonensis]|uniref:Uncharacterized protein n=2 Tax=Bowmanella dokdonensis TaxID=751969 RepID=A0A939DLY0_9ALTE|nr:hypothetical protein [Bowmanella dokdonensis]